MSDEEYLLSQVVSNLKTDLPLAKSWMMFARSVYPYSFPILFQCYKLNKDENNINECALLLRDIVNIFPQKVELADELKCLANALCFDDDNFYKEIFKQMLDDVKDNIMLIVKKISLPTDEHCKFMLSFLKNMPNASFVQYGEYIIDKLLTAERETEIPVNIYRKMLVNDVLPLVLKASVNEFKCMQPFGLFEKAIEFYICGMFLHLNSQNLVDKDSGLLSRSSLEEVWEPLLKLLETFALKCKWNHPELLFSNFNEQSLNKFMTLLKKEKKLSLNTEKFLYEKEFEREEVYFCTVVVFFYYLYTFGNLIHPSMFSNLTAESYNYILMEGISFSSNNYSDKTTSDFILTEKGYFFVSKCVNKEASDMLLCSFLTVVDCWELLQQHSSLRRSFENLCKNIKLETWPVFQEFKVSLLISARAHDNAINYLREIQDNTANLRLKILLQKASSCYSLGKYDQSLTILFDVVMNFPLKVSSTVIKRPVPKSSDKYLYFMGCNKTEIIQYCISILLKLYKWKWNLIHDSSKCMSVAYTLVLLQYDVDHEYDLLRKCLKYIRKQGTFQFPTFFNYIINVYILEEIYHLATPSGGNVKLNIMPDCVPQISESCAESNVSDETYRENLKVAFESQMARWNESLDDIYIEFIRKEQNFLLIPLANCM